MAIIVTQQCDNRSHKPFVVKECNAYFSMTCNLLFGVHAYPKYFETLLEAPNEEKIKPFVQPYCRLQICQAKLDFYYKGYNVLDGPRTQGFED